VDLLRDLHRAELRGDAGGHLSAHEDGGEHGAQLAEDGQRHHRAHVVLRAEARHVHRALERQHHAREERGGERHHQRADADDVDLARDEPEIRGGKRQVARDLGGEEREPPVPDQRLARVDLRELGRGHCPAPGEKLSTKAWKSRRPASNCSGGATYRKSWTQRSPFTTSDSTSTSRPSTTPRSTRCAAGRPPTIRVSLSTVTGRVSPKTRWRARTGSGRPGSGPSQVASASMPPAGTSRRSSRSASPRSTRQPFSGSRTVYPFGE